MEPKTNLPNATAVLVLGICSLVFMCFGIGIVLAIIGLVLAANGRRLYAQDPDNYNGYGSLNAGFIMSIIGLVLGVIMTIVTVLYYILVYTIVTEASQQPYYY